MWENEDDSGDKEKEKDEFLNTEDDGLTEISSEEEVQILKAPSVTLTKPNSSIKRVDQNMIRPGIFHSK